MVNEEDDIGKHQKAFGINPENTNYSSVESAPFPVPDNFDNFQHQQILPHFKQEENQDYKILVMIYSYYH